MQEALCFTSEGASEQVAAALTCPAHSQRQQGRQHRSLAEQRGPHPGRSSPTTVKGHGDQPQEDQEEEGEEEVEEEEEEAAAEGSRC